MESVRREQNLGRICFYSRYARTHRWRAKRVAENRLFNPRPRLQPTSPPPRYLYFMRYLDLGFRINVRIPFKAATVPPRFQFTFRLCTPRGLITYALAYLHQVSRVS